eukprot:11052608-Lingulodinium_polyedra.AAC.1
MGNVHSQQHGQSEEAQHNLNKGPFDDAVGDLAPVQPLLPSDERARPPGNPNEPLCGALRIEFS